MLAACVGVMTDIDDTLTRDGVIQPAALDALQRLQRVGLPVIAITGRPMGWSLPFARDWPVAAIVAENGAVALQRASGDVAVSYAQDDATRVKNKRRLDAVAARIVGEVPGALQAQDSDGRVTDIAIDHSEFTTLGAGNIQRVVDIMASEGMNATVSSIHVNGWFGAHTKWTGACWIVQRLLGRDLAREVASWIYIGDSTNDQVMFAQCPNAVGVANLRRFADVLTTWPSYLTDGERGDGVAEVVAAVLKHRSA